MTNSPYDHLSREELISRLRSAEAERDALRAKYTPDHPGTMFTQAIDNISEAIVIYDKDGCLMAWNENFARLYNYSEEDLKPGTHFSELGRIDIEKGNVAVGDEFGGGEEYLRRKAEYRKKLEGSFIVHLKDGRWIKTTDRPMDHGGFVSVQVDVTELKRMEQHMRFLAQHDQLTQLPNRNLFVENGAMAIAQARRNKELVAILFVDVDEYKQVNDQYGHRIGDDVLREIANRLKSRLRESDLVARIGGDEFVVLLPQQVDKATARQVAQALLEEMERPIFLDSYKITISVSIGLSFFPDDGDNLDQLIQRADSAMYKAKDQGKNTWIEVKEII